MRWSDQLRQAVRREFALLARVRASGREPLRARQVEQELNWLRPQPQDRVLDLACGPGSYTWKLAGWARFVVGADLAPEMLDQACRAGILAGHSAESAGKNAGPTFVAADAYQLPFAAASFDLVVCGFSFAHFPDAVEVAREVARVLVPQGRVAVVDLVAESPQITRLERFRERIYTRVPAGPELVARFREAGLLLERARRFRRRTRFRKWAASSNLPRGSASLERARRLLEQAATAGEGALRVRRIGDDFEFAQSVAAFVFRKSDRACKMQPQT